ncbi:phosphoribosylformylglycinamidine synthase subunit PurQ [Aciditerrimonas ferrireducens]|uniref:Phosphoribosylformylglycinamidine synthase subunit PurQ n=1 Tax=Aciditerrimonas ferrireducens TaxID=667306 RepID=A0ABV6BYM1_9ACTN
MTARVGVVVFPGTNCEHDVAEALRRLGGEARMLWHQDPDLHGVEAVVLPGGFAHGDYLRPGALARFSPVMGAVADFAAAGGPVVGICNGFQVLTEAGLLPGALGVNRSLRFVCRPVRLRVERTGTVLTGQAEAGQELVVPVNHFSGAYRVDPATLERLEAAGQVVLRYLENPNGSQGDVAGVCNEAGNVVGLMPHPERASDPLQGGTDGQVLLRSLLAAALDRSASGARR